MLALTLTPLMAHGQEKSPQGRVVLEEEEITLFDDYGKESEKLYVSRNGKEKQRILTQVKEKTLRKLGVNSIDEIKKEKGLMQKYNEENHKLVRVEEIRQPKLKFIAANGNIVKRIELGEKTTSKKFKDATISKEWNGYQVNSKSATISENQEYCLIIDHLVWVRHNINDPKESGDYVKTYGEGAYAPPPQEAKLVLLNNTGKELFQKKIEQGSIAGGPRPDMVVSNNGSVAFMTSKGEGPGKEVLYAYDREGRSLLTFPDSDKDVKVHPEGDINISPNGKFLAVKAGYLGEGMRLVVFDLTTGKRWKAEKPYAVFELNDNGQMKLAFGRENLEIDLKQRFEE